MNITDAPLPTSGIPQSHPSSEFVQAPETDVVLPASPDSGLSLAGVAGWGWVAGRGRRVGWWLLGVQVVVVVVFAVVYRPFDLRVYLWGGEAVRHGLVLYDVRSYLGNWFTYPPFAAMLFIPLDAVPAVAAGLVWELATMAALAWAAVSCLRLAGYRPAPAAVAAITAAAVITEPVYHTLFLGQVNVILLAVILADLRRAAAGRRAGIGIGLAAAVKLTPALFIVLLAATRRWKNAGLASVTFAACGGLGWAVNPAASKLYWTRLFDDTSRVSATYISNQSPYALLTRLMSGPGHVGSWYLAISAALALAGVAAAAAYARHGQWLPATAITGITTLLVSPISWTHHWVWAIPALLTLTLPTPGTSPATTTAGASPRPRISRPRLITAAAAYLLFAIAPMWYTPWANDSGQYGFHWATTLAANSFLIAGLAYLTHMTLQTRHLKQVPDGAEAASQPAGNALTAS